MWRPAVEEIGVTRAEHRLRATHRHLDLAGDDDPAFAGLVRQHRLAGIGARRIGLVEDLQPVRQRVADLRNVHAVG